MRWYWIVLIIIVVLAIIIGIWYYVASNKNLEQLDTYNSQLNSMDFNSGQEVMSFVLESCNNANSKLLANLISLSGISKYMAIETKSDVDALQEYKTQLCSCMNSKFSIIDIFNSVDDCSKW